MVKFPAAKPSIILPKNKKNNEFALAKISQPSEVLKMLIKSTGLLPILSESAPKKGLEKKAHSEKVENNNVTVNAEAPNSFK